jgi:hypothetical protein
VKQQGLGSYLIPDGYANGIPKRTHAALFIAVGCANGMSKNRPRPRRGQNTREKEKLEVSGCLVLRIDLSLDPIYMRVKS